jgi:hypothetical protein
MLCPALQAGLDADGVVFVLLAASREMVQSYQAVRSWSSGSVLVKHFDVAAFLVAHGADVNTDWATHEPASILHECAVHGHYEGVRFLLAHGVDPTRHDYR